MSLMLNSAKHYENKFGFTTFSMSLKYKPNKAGITKKVLTNIPENWDQFTNDIPLKERVKWEVSGLGWQSHDDILGCLGSVWVLGVERSEWMIFLGSGSLGWVAMLSVAC